MRSRVPTEAIKSAIASKRLWLTLLAIIITFLCFFPSRAQKMKNQSFSQTNTDHQCIANLKRIGKLIKRHLHHSAGVLGFPTNLDTIYSMSLDPKLFICPADKEINTSIKGDSLRTSYEIVNDPLKPELSATPPDRIAIIAEKRPNHNDKRFVLFYDLSVREFDEAQFKELKSNSFILRN